MTQSPGSTPPHAPYTPRSISLAAVDRVRWVCRRCAGKTVLHLGCMCAPNVAASIATGRHMHLSLSKVCARLTGVDLDLTHRGLLPADSDTHDIREADVCDQSQLAAAIAGRTYDVVVAGELLEHLLNPGLCLTAIGALLPAATLIVTVPNALHRGNAARARRGVELVHEDHVCWYSPRTIETLLHKCGWIRNVLYAAGRPRHRWGKGNLQCPVIVIESRR